MALDRAQEKRMGPVQPLFLQPQVNQRDDGRGEGGTASKDRDQEPLQAVTAE